MPPQEVEGPIYKSSLRIKYPKHRDDIRLSPDLWLDDRRADDGAEGLWRIHDRLYDLSEWIDQHPGGRDWIRLTKGTDITEAFESHHISTSAEQLLPKFLIRETTTPRNCPFVFHKDGFYNTLKNRVREALKDVPEKATLGTKIMTDALMAGYVITAILAALIFSFILGLVSGLLLGLTTIAAHNYFHQKDSFRMYYFDFSLMSSREWRISHAMSHHLYPNTVIDLEVSLPQPYLFYLPVQDNIFRRAFACAITPLFCFFILIGSAVRRYVLTLLGYVKEFNVTEILPYSTLVLMCIVGWAVGQSITWTIFLWLWIISVASFYFGFIGITAAHHHPEIFHDGDTPREDLDWGLFQMTAVMDRHEITGSPFLVLTTFGDHTLHHLFPTIDHGKLSYLYPVLKETCEKFGVEIRFTTQWQLIVGQYWQLLRTFPNPLPPGKQWKWHKDLSLDVRNKFINGLQELIQTVVIHKYRKK